MQILYISSITILLIALFCTICNRKSLKRFDVFTVAMGCFLLASKVEEKPKILREVCNKLMLMMMLMLML